MSFARITERADNFRDIGVWPRQQDVNVEYWLENFRVDEEDIAKKLLASFSYFNKSSTDALLKQAIQNYLSNIWDDANSLIPPSDISLESVVFVMCEGEDPHATDSGNYFARRLRDVLRIPEPRIKSPHAALEISDHVSHYIFVDDFVGSGNQFLETIFRVHQSGSKYDSFASMLKAGTHRVAYCACVATSYALDTRLKTALPNVEFHPAHVLGDQHNLIKPRSRIWHGLTDAEAQSEIARIKTISARAGYTGEDRGLNDWRGFHGLGLSLAFEHGIPDASLPLFYSTRNGWRPLMRRAQ